MEPLARVLIVDDEEPILDFLEMGLEAEGFLVSKASSGRAALESFSAERPQAVVLDVMLPDLSGLEVCRRIRAGSDVPILMLTALAELDDKVLGLDSGADDYLAKPFKIRELQARLRALLRRSGHSGGKTLQFAGIQLQRETRQVSLGQQPLRLTAREFDILEILLRHPRQVISREQILSQIWGFDYEGETNVVEVHIRALRKKLNDTDRSLLRAVRGYGYVLGSEA